MMKLRTFAITAPLLALASGYSFAQSILANYSPPSTSNISRMDDAEITPDGRYIVVREDFDRTAARVYDALTGSLLVRYYVNHGFPHPGVAQDAVAVTNTRGVVLGDPSRIIDLTNLTSPELAILDLGHEPRDLEITPDGTLVAIRGGSGPSGGLFVYDLATATLVAQAPGAPMLYSAATDQFDVDSVAVTDRYAAFISSPQAVETRVTIMDLHPTGGGAPVVVYETGPSSDNDLIGTPHDVTMTPDGKHLVVRSEMAVALFSLTGASPSLMWIKRLYGNPGPMGYAAMDSVEATNDRIATISRWSNGGFGTQVDVFDMAGNQRYQVIEGDPHDLAITPNGRKCVVRTHTSVYLYDLANIAGGLNLHYYDKKDSIGTHTSYGAGMDSVQVTETMAITTSRVNETTDVRLWDITDGTLIQTAQHTMPARPVDVAFVPSGDRAVVSGLSHIMVIDTISKGVLMNTETNSGGGYPWCDGVALNDSRAVVFGAFVNGCAGCFSGAGWLTIVDLFDEPNVFCGTNANSSGEVGATHATGSASVAANNLHVVASDLPKHVSGAFLYGDGQVNTPFGGGVLCVGGQSGYFSMQNSGANGLAELSVDMNNLPFGSPSIVVGSTRNFQFLFRDASAAQVNTTAGLEVTFTL